MFIKIKNKILNFFKNSEFNRNIATVFSGTAIGTIIPIISMIFLARIYDPLSFGILAIYEGITNILIHVSTGKYELAIFSVNKKKKYIYILFIVTILSVLVSILSLIVFVIFDLDLFLGILVSLGIFANSSFLVSSNIIIKNKQFKRYTKLIIAKSIIVVVIQFGLHLFSYDKFGLIIGVISGFLFFSISFLISEIKSNKQNFNLLELKNLYRTSIEYIEFPKFSILSNLIFSFGIQAPVFFLSSYFSISDSGNYAQAKRNIDMPTLLVANSVGHVYKEKFSNAFANSNNFYSIFLSTIKKLIVIGFFPCMIIFLFGEHLFLILLGEQWGDAGRLASILSLILFMRFIFVPVSYTYSIVGKQKIELFWQIALASSIFISLIFGFLSDSVFTTIQFYVIFGSVVYFFNILYLNYLIKQLYNKMLYENGKS